MKTTTKLGLGIAVVALLLTGTHYSFADNTNSKPFKDIWDAIKALEQKVATIALTPGPQGPQGEPGPKGDTGDIGPAGSQGEQGATGPQGLQGEKGDTGPQGEPGPAGSQGEKGEKGDTGEVGIGGTGMLPTAKVVTFFDDVTGQSTAFESPVMETSGYDMLYVYTAGSGNNIHFEASVDGIKWHRVYSVNPGSKAEIQVKAPKYRAIVEYSSLPQVYYAKGYLK